MMQALTESCPQQLASFLPPVIGSIGRQGFDARLVRFLHNIYGAQHMALMCLSHDHMQGLLTSSLADAESNYQRMFIYTNQELWRRDPTYEMAIDLLGSKSSVAIGMNVRDFDDRVLRDDIYGRRGIKHRAILCSRVDDGVVILAICSEKPALTSQQNLELMESNSPIVFSLVSKHISVANQKFNVSEAFNSIEEIEDVIAHGMQCLPVREVQVCSRTVFGMSSIGIGEELEIGRETVATYRKRAYGRLGIATQRELFLWYLAIWSEQRGKYLTWKSKSQDGQLVPTCIAV